MASERGFGNLLFDPHKVLCECVFLERSVMLPEIVELVRNRIDVSRKMRRWSRLQKQGPTATLDTKLGRLTIDTRD